MKKITMTSLLCFAMIAPSAFATDTNTQTNTSGSNTTITGGYTSSTTNSYSGGQTNTTTSTTTNTTTGTDTRVAASVSAPSMSAYSQDLCIVGISGGISTIGLGISGETYVTDENCERIKLSKVLNDLGMKVASVSILCQDPRVFYAMEQSGTPCPFEGKIGKAASDQWKKYNKLRPDYVQYTERLWTVEQHNKQVKKKQELDDYKKKLKIKKELDVEDKKELDKLSSKIEQLEKDIENDKKKVNKQNSMNQK